ncbi:MAG: hypothetical protein R8G33_03155 [Gammaproteobacteria bacterium]|nr:hypothetical protein [Gammaproteobacteria bacterium]
MNLFISSISVTALLATTSGAYIKDHSVDERPISEYCAMATKGYELVNIESQALIDQNTLPAPFHTQPIANYRLVPGNDWPEDCEIYFASN